MRVAFHAPLKPPDHPVPSGDRRMGRLLMDALQAAGCQVDLASRFRSFDGDGNPQRQARIRDLGARLAQRYLDRPGGERPALWFTYHLYHKAPDWIGPPVAKALRIPYVVAEASFAPKQAGGPWNMGHEAVAGALRMAHQVISFNPDDAGCLEDLLGDAGRLSCLAPFLDTGPARAAAGRREENRRRLAERFDIDTTVPWIAVAAMMRPGDKLKSYRVLGAALERLGNLRWTLLVAGDGPARAGVEAALGDSRRIRYLGELDRAALDGLHAGADLTAWPAVNEAYGMALLEAQAAGSPVVAGDRAGVRQIVRDGRTGLLAPEGDSGAFAAALAALLDDSGRREAMRAEALRVTAAGHDIGTAAARLKAILARAAYPATEPVQ